MIKDRVQSAFARFKKPTVDIVADYGHPGDIAFHEVQNYLEGSRRFQRKPDYRNVSVFFPSPITAGFTIAQLGLYDRLRPRNHVIFSNVAPRGTKPGNATWFGGDGHEQEFVYAKLKNGTDVFGIQGEAFSLIKDDIVDFRRVNVTNNNHSFRSREQYAPAVAAFLRGGKSRRQILGEQIDTATIPDLPKDIVLYADGYGDIKTSIRRDDFLKRNDVANQEFITVTINGVSRKVRNTLIPGNNGKTGELVLQLGSSGGDTENRFLEVDVLTGIGDNTAAKIFGYYNTYDDDRKIVIEPEQ